DGGHRTRLTPEQPLKATYARWSPVGDTILLSNSRGGTGDIWTINADGSEARRIGEGLIASWSLDGRKVAVVKDESEIDILSADGARLNTIDLGAAKGKLSLNDAPAWSPDGRRLAFLTDIPYVARADGKGAAEPLRSARGIYLLLAWAADGRSLIGENNG